MAILRTIQCTICNQTKSEARSSTDYSNICGDCQDKIADQQRRQHLAGLKGLTVEERLEKIEAWIYDYKPYVDPLTIPYG